MDQIQLLLEKRTVEKVNAATNTDSESDLSVGWINSEGHIGSSKRSTEVKVRSDSDEDSASLGDSEEDEESTSKEKKKKKWVRKHDNREGNSQIGAKAVSPPSSLAKNRTKRENLKYRDNRHVSWEDRKSKSRHGRSLSRSRRRVRDYSSSDTDTDQDKHIRRGNQRNYGTSRSRRYDRTDRDDSKRSRVHRRRQYDESSESDVNEGRRESKMRRSLHYDGKSNWNAFYSKFRRMAWRCKWSLKQSKDELCYSLEGAAIEYFCMLEEQDPHMSYSEVIRKMDTRFGYRDLDESVQIQFFNLYQKDDEDIDSWADRVMKMATRAFKKLPESYMAEQAAMKICQGCSDKCAAQSALLHRPKTVESAIEAIKWSRHTNQSIFGTLYTNTRAMSIQSEDKPREKRFNRSPPPSPRSAPRRECYQCGGSDHFKRECPNAKLYCFYCGEETHLVKDCTVRQRYLKGLCFGCGEKSHFIQDCPNVKSKRKTENERGGTGRVGNPPQN